MVLGRVESVQMTGMGTELLDSSSAECITGGDQHIETILN